MILLATPSDPTRLDVIDTIDVSQKVLRNTTVNRGYTRYSRKKNGTKVIDSVVFHQNPDRGVVMFHELFHALMFMCHDQHPSLYLSTPWGRSEYMETLAEVYGNIMVARMKDRKMRISFLRDRLEVYKRDAMNLIQLMKKRSYRLDSNFVSYLCGTYVMLVKMGDRVTWLMLCKHPNQLMSQVTYMKYGPT